MEDKNKIAREVLQKLLPAISHIDNGCSDCIGDFCLLANEELEEYGFKLVDTGNDPVRVQLHTIDDENE